MHLHAQSTCIHTGSKCLLIDTNQEASRHMAYMLNHFSLVKGTGSIEKLIQALQIYLKVAILFRAWHVDNLSSMVPKTLDDLMTHHQVSLAIRLHVLV